MELLNFSCDWDFFFSRLGKKSPKLHWEWGLISAPDTPEKIPGLEQTEAIGSASDFLPRGPKFDPHQGHGCLLWP